jgi:hypothetical protein
MKQFLLGALATLLVLAIASLAYLIFGFAEVRGELPPSKIEAYLMQRAVHASRFAGKRKHSPTQSSLQKIILFAVEKGT